MLKFFLKNNRVLYFFSHILVEYSSSFLADIVTNLCFVESVRKEFLTDFLFNFYLLHIWTIKLNSHMLSSKKMIPLPDMMGHSTNSLQSNDYKISINNKHIHLYFSLLFELFVSGDLSLIEMSQFLFFRLLSLPIWLENK